MIRILACIGAAIAVSGASATAQMVPDVEPGTRVRVSTPGFAPTGQYVIGSGSWIVGEVIRIDEDGLTLDTDGTGDEGGFSIPLSAIRRLEVSQGTIDSHAAGLSGARRGAVLGTLTGGGLVAFHVLVGGSPEDWLNTEGVGGIRFYQMVGGGLVLGTVAGYLSGSAAKEQWGPHPAWRVSVGTDGARHQIAIRIR
jgi:hypothetical protein